MKHILIILFSLSVSIVHGGGGDGKYTVPDLKKIETETQAAKSPHYYPKLFLRYMDNDTTLGLEDYRYLYYGSSFQPGYSSLATLPGVDSVKSIFRKGTLTTDDYHRLEKFAQMDLVSDPYSLDNLKLLTWVYEKTGRRDLYRKLRYKLDKVADAILSTGDGTSSESGWYVINISHEYDIITLFGMQFGGEQRLIEGAEGPCDYLTLADNEKNIKGLYFNVTITMHDLKKMLGDPSKRSKK